MGNNLAAIKSIGNSLKIFKTLLRILKSCSFSICLGMLVVKQIAAHEVSSSRVVIATGAHAIEVVQTTATDVVYAIAKQLPDNEEVEILNDDQAVKWLSSGWQINSTVGPCKLSRLAYQRIHEGEQLQIRYLFSCSENLKPNTLEIKDVLMGWFDHTENDHFIFLTIASADDERTIVFEHPRTRFNLTNM